MCQVGDKVYKPVQPVEAKQRLSTQEGRSGQILLLMSAAVLIGCGLACALSALYAPMLVDDSIATSCAMIEFQCLDTDSDGCVSTSEYESLCERPCANSSSDSFSAWVEATSLNNSLCGRHMQSTPSRV